MADCPVNHTGLCVDGWAGNCTEGVCKLVADQGRAEDTTTREDVI